ncbi:hypothetical protein GCM10027578_07840 [Spirosoma luteolum]
MNPSLTDRAETYVVRFFDEHPNPALVYHTLAHTREVVDVADQLARHYALPETDWQALLTAAWFHDVGYLAGPPDAHEETGLALATAFLENAGATPDYTDRVQRAIRATKMPQSPTTLAEQILCDADLFHLGAADYNDRQKRLRDELEQLTGKSLKGSTWRQKNIDFLQHHRYFTDYAQTLQADGQARNLRRLLNKEAEQKAIRRLNQQQPAAEPGDHKDRPKTKEQEKRAERGVETMFRTTSANHLHLSEIADSKANILISVNSIMVSVLVSILPRRIEENPALIIPTALFLISALLTIVSAILATRPNVNHGSLTRKDVQQRKGNPLFFGNFYQMSRTDYEWTMGELMQDSDYLYKAMTRDIYNLGQVLAKKYRLLRIAYTVFMLGFVLSTLAFLVVFVITGN